ncbi:transcription termination/antitermination protein NusG [Croceibacterium sp. TMG7-5b_MA50]|jgi:transcription termination/antitermination protein NusG|uniref:transcription termination/antitermination protein NusG n=1 Tax=Croceibacterium sp. TMG7-5b_MA50 TaxID=3121290 RepID=UPI003221A92C
MPARWYIIHAYSGFENKVRESILSEAERMGLAEAVEEVQVPTETVNEVKRGKRVQVERKFMPGYVLAKLNMTDDVYHLVKNTPKVTGFLGNGGKPQAISEREAARYFGGMEEAKAAPKKQVSVDYEIGDQVKVNAGPFTSFNGIVEELDFDKSRVKVSVSIFGRATPVELGFEEVELVK